jgi:hypothetical protein
MRRLGLATVALALATGAAWAQPTVSAGPPQQVLEKGLFGESEPGDEEAERAPLPPAPTPTRVEPSTATYDARVRQSYAAAEAFRGKLDGGWVVSWRGGDLLQLQLVDKGKGSVEGAWRDLRAGAGLAASGLLDATPVTDGVLDAAFGPPGRGARAYRLSLRPASAGRLTGTLRVYDEVFDVTVRHEP